MRKSNIWNIVFTIWCCFIMNSCSMIKGKQTPLHKLEKMTKEIRIHHEEYTIADWKKAYAQYEQIAAEMEDYQYSKEEAEKIGKLEGECVGYFMKSAIKSFDGLESEIKGFLEGIEDVVK